MNRVKKEEKKKGKKFPSFKMNNKEYDEIMAREENERIERLKKLSKPK